MIDAALVIGVAVSLLFLGMMLIRSFGHMRVARDADRTTPPGILKPH
jgi:hypothetical protein